MQILGFEIPILWVLILVAIPVTFMILFLLLSKVIGGMGATMVFGGLMKLVGLILKMIFGAVAWITRKMLFKTKEYTDDQSNESLIWNVQAVLFLSLSLIFIIATPGELLKVYEYKSEGWLFLAIIGLFSIFTGPKIANAPILKKLKFTKEWGKTIILFITGLTTSSAIVHLIFKFLYFEQPSFTLFASMLVYLGFIGFITYKLVLGDQGVSTLERLERAMKKTLESKDANSKKQLDEEQITSSEEKVPDFQVALSKPTQKKPKKSPIVLPEVSRYQHMQIIGPTGTGKSILGLNLATQDILNYNHGLVALEPTKDFVRSLRAVAKNTGRKYYFVDPTDPNTEIINPLDGDDFDEIAEINASAFVGYLGNNANEFYKNKQKNALRMAIKVAKVIKGDDATYDDLIDILRPGQGDLRKKYANQIEDSRIRKDLEDYAMEFSDKKMFNNAIQNYNGLFDYLKELTTNKYMRKVICGKSTVRLRDVFNNGDILLVTTAYGKLKQLGFVLGRLVITMLQSEVFARTELEDTERDLLPPMAIYIDEVQNYVSEPFAEIFEMARKAKLMMHILHQGLAQLRNVSERLEETIFDNARQKVVFGGTNIKDCKMFAERIGEYYENVSSTSSDILNPLRNTVSSSEQLRFRMTPDEIFKLPGFQTDTLEPAEVLLLLVVHNRIQSEQIGLIAPLPRKVFKEVKIEDDGIENNSKENSQIIEIKQENDTIIANKNSEKKLISDDYLEDLVSNQESEDENPNVVELHQKKKRRRKRGKRKKSPVENSVENNDINKSDSPNTTIDMEDDIIDEEDNFDDILMELTDSK
jgi:hypothetical protein